MSETHPTDNLVRQFNRRMAEIQAGHEASERADPDNARLEALIRTVPIGPFGPNAKALMTDEFEPRRRKYTSDELRALRAVDRHEWNRSGDPTLRGPAQYAGGDWWPSELMRKAHELERRAVLYRIAAVALRREIASDPLNRPVPTADTEASS